MREMKDSGIEWIGEIPCDWKLERSQWHLEEVNTSNNPIQTNNVLSLTNKLGVVPYEEKGNQGNKSKENVYEYKLAYPNTIVANSMNILIGSVGLCDYFGCVSPVYYVFKAKKHNNIKFLNYVFQTVGFQRELRKYANGILEIRLRVSASDILKRFIPFPNENEQQRIAEFLDRACRKIDGLKADIQAQIDTLEQYKRSVITEAVTHGLNPSAPMKDSGIPWVGKIPAKWAVLPIYCVYGERKRKNVFGTEQNLLSLSYGKVIRKDINTNGGLLPSNYNGYNIIEKNDIIIRPTDLQNDRTSLRTGLVKEHVIITSAYIALKPKNRVSSKFYHYLLHSYDVKKVFYNMGNGVRQGLNYGEFAKLMVYYPPLDEQQEIADYLDNKCAAIEQIIADKKSQIETLDGYKKSLIYEYVTGKKEVV